MDVVVVGSANVDTVIEVEDLPRPGQTSLARGVREGPGGKGLNQAVAASRSGATTALIAVTGQDASRLVLVAELESAGVDTARVRACDVRTGRAFVLVDATGENTIVVDAGANDELLALRSEELDLLRGAAVVLCQLEVPLPAVAAALSAAEGLTVLNAAPARSLPADLLQSLDVLVVNEHEARELGGAHDLETALGALLQQVPEVVVTLGADGAIVGARGNESFVVPGQVAREVADTTGAGDTFCGAYAAARARGADGFEAAGWAVLAATLAVERPGAARSAPTRAEVLARWPEA